MTRLAAKLADGKDGKAAALLAAAWETAANEPPARPPEPFLPAGFGAAATRWHRANFSSLFCRLAKPRPLWPFRHAAKKCVI